MAQESEQGREGAGRAKGSLVTGLGSWGMLQYEQATEP